MFWKRKPESQETLDRIATDKALRKYRSLGDDLMRQLKAISEDHPRRGFTSDKVLYELANNKKVESFHNDLLDCLRKHNVSITDWGGVYLRFNDLNQEAVLRDLAYAIDPY